MYDQWNVTLVYEYPDKYCTPHLHCAALNNRQMVNAKLIIMFS